MSWSSGYHPRLAPDQHTKRFLSGTGLILKDFNIEKMAIQQLASPKLQSRPNETADSSAPSETNAPMDLDHDDEALELGLQSTAKPGEEVQKKPRAKKRTQAEIYECEYEKAVQEMDSLLKLVTSFMDGKTFGLELGKTDRSIAKKIREASDNHAFDFLNKLKKLYTKLELLRMTTKNAKIWIGGRAAAKKLGKAPFLESLDKLEQGCSHVPWPIYTLDSCLDLQIVPK